MATPKTFDDASDTRLRESNLNKFIAADGSKVTAKKLWARVRYNGSAWEVVSSVSSSGLTSPSLAWDTDHLVISVTGYTEVPEVQVTQNVVANPYIMQAEGDATDEVFVYFFTVAGTPGTAVTTEDTSMSIDVEITGA